MPRIAVLIPCWNEALTIEKVVTDFRAVLPEADIYVYDNNSTDGTAEIAKRTGPPKWATPPLVNTASRRPAIFGERYIVKNTM